MALMTTERPAADSSADELLATLDTLSLPDGFRAELIDAEIVVTPPPDGDHEDIFGEVAWQFGRHSEALVRVAGAKGLETPSGRYIPDGAVAPPGHFKGAPPWAGTNGVLLVFEITSTNPRNDRVSKRAGCAAAGIPCYLLIDRSEEKVTLFTAPEEGDYAKMTQVKFGKRLPLPAPFSFELDTTTFA